MIIMFCFLSSFYLGSRLCLYSNDPHGMDGERTLVGQEIDVPTCAGTRVDDQVKNTFDTCGSFKFVCLI